VKFSHNFAEHGLEGSFAPEALAFSRAGCTFGRRFMPAFSRYAPLLASLLVSVLTLGSVIVTGLSPVHAQTSSRKLTPPPPSPDDGTKLSLPIATFSGLDKITGRIISFDVAINETVQFGALQVTPRVCYARPQTIAPLTTGFVEVDEITLDNKIRRIFTGWMFADSPGLHAVEHAVYDVWLTECKAAPGTAPTAPAAADPTPPKPVKP